MRKVLYSESGRVVSKNRIERAAYICLSKIPTSLVFRFYEFLTKAKPSKHCRAIAFPTPKGNWNFGNPAEYYENYCDIKFEDRIFRVMAEHKKYLSYKYGNDYMVIPPPEKRHFHPAAEIKFPKEFE